VRIEECKPMSKRKTWLVVERNGQAFGETTAQASPGHLPEADAPAAHA